MGKLECNPILAMSLGNKELFPSNLLAWFISRYQPVAQALGLPGEVVALREKEHTDLLIKHGDQRLMIIENKVFALPDTRQLARLSDHPKAGAGKLVLLSLTSPCWPDWTWTSRAGNRQIGTAPPVGAKKTWDPADESLAGQPARASADSEVRPGPRPPTLRPHRRKTVQAGPEALSTSSLPTLCGP